MAFLPKLLKKCKLKEVTKTMDENTVHRKVREYLRYRDDYVFNIFPLKCICNVTFEFKKSSILLNYIRIMSNCICFTSKSLPPIIFIPNLAKNNFSFSLSFSKNYYFFGYLTINPN